MESLIEFLSNNIFILILIFGFISSLFKKKAADQQKTRQQPTRGTSLFDDFEDDVGERRIEPEMFSEPEPDKEITVETMYDQKDELIERARNNFDELRRRKEAYASTSSRVSPDLEITVLSDETSPVYNHSIDFNKRSIVDGIIMSEVLGAPKARKYMPRRR